MKISANLLVLFLFFFLWISSVYARVLKFEHSMLLNTENFELGLVLLECKKTS